MNPSVEDRAYVLDELHRELSLELSLDGKRYKKHFDLDQPIIPHFVIGDMVWLL